MKVSGPKSIAKRALQAAFAFNITSQTEEANQVMISALEAILEGREWNAPDMPGVKLEPVIRDGWRELTPGQRERRVMEMLKAREANKSK